MEKKTRERARSKRKEVVRDGLVVAKNGEIESRFLKSRKKI